jgi:Flp pilus assembly protein TadD
MNIRAALVIALLGLAGCAGGADKTALNLQSGATPRVDPTVLLAAAEATRNEGRFSEAVEIYQQVLSADATSVAGQYGMAECLFSLGRPKDAKSIFEALTKNAEYRTVSLQGSGLSALALDQREDAAKSLRLAVAEDSKLWRAYNGLGLIADYKHQSGEAETFYDKAMALNPDSATLFNNRGYSRLTAGSADTAIADFQQSLGLDPSSETVQNNLRLALAVKGDYAAATRGVAHENVSMVLNNVGVIAMQRGDLDAAEGMLSQSMVDSPNYNDVAARNLVQVGAAKGIAK